MNIFHSGWLSVGNVRYGYTSRDKFLLKGNLAEKMSGLVLTETDGTLWVVFDREQFSTNECAQKD